VRSTCKQVILGEWAPLGSALPEPCPTSGFYCPGAANDAVNGGSKPIIIPVGDSTTTKKVETVQKQMTVDLDCATFDLAAMKTTLATQYNVDVALISLNNPCVRRRQRRLAELDEFNSPPQQLPPPDWMLATHGRALAATSITITIATEGTKADGTPITAAANDLITAVNSVADSQLGTSLSSALGTTITITASSAPSKAVESMTVKFTCPKGKWCTAGLIVDCTEGTYNPLTGQDLGTACKKCPEFSTSPKASTSINDCVCQDGFIQTILPDGTAKCECDAGKEIMNGVRCDSCSPGTYKPVPGNTKCTDCRSSPLPLAAKEDTTTATPGAKLATDCVCKIGYYLVADEVSGQQSCKPCSSTWRNGRVGTDCSVAGITLETLPILPGFFRQSTKAQVVRKCIAIDAEAACQGSQNASTAIRQRLTLDVAAEDFDEAGFKLKLSALYGVSPDEIEIAVAPGSLQMTVTIKTSAATAATGANGAPAPPRLSTDELNQRVSSTALAASTLGVGVSKMSAAQLEIEDAARCAVGYTGPYCAVCAIGYHGGGEGKTCIACADSGMDPTTQIAIQLGGAFAMLLVGTLLMMKFGKKVLQGAASTLEKMDQGELDTNDMMASGVAGSVEDEDEEEGKAVAEKPESEPEKAPKKKKRSRCSPASLIKGGIAPIVKLTKALSEAGVKMKILVSLYQVLNGLGLVFSIPYPDTYTEMMNNIGSIELNVPSLLPIDCLLGGINFFHVLVIQTALPLILIAILYVVGKAADKAGDLSRRKMDADGLDRKVQPQPLGYVLSELCATVSFFLLFLLYPGSSNKIFNALMCSSFNGEGEDGQSFLRVDFSIDCNSFFYNGIMKP
jgi:hypothetical protein